MLLFPLPPSGCVQRGKRVMGSHPHPSWHWPVELIIISPCGLFDTNNTGQLHPLNSLITMFPGRWQLPRGPGRATEARPEFLGLPARAKTPMPLQQQTSLQQISQLRQWTSCHWPLRTQTGAEGRKVEENWYLRDYIRTPGSGTTLEDGEVRDPPVMGVVESPACFVGRGLGIH